jgi:hypothetical protein
VINLRKKFQIIFPDNRFVPLVRLIQWANDAVDNGDTSMPKPRTITDVVNILEDSGYATFHCSVSTFLNTPAAHELIDDESADGENLRDEIEMMSPGQAGILAARQDARDAANLSADDLRNEISRISVEMDRMGIAGDHNIGDVLHAINQFGNGQHPMATPDNVRFFKREYVQKCIDDALAAQLADDGDDDVSPAGKP